MTHTVIGTETTTRPPRERDLLDAAEGTYTLDELYDLVHAAGPDVTGREAGEDVIHGLSDTRWRRRVRGALQSMKRQGRAHRAGPGVWVIDGRPEAPRRVVLVTATGRLDDLELRLGDAADLLSSLEEPADLVLTDPPYGLGVGAGMALDTGARTYARDHQKVLPGYVDVDPAEYRAFTRRWVSAAAAALRPGGYLAVVTGPQQSAWVQVAAEDAGLEYVNSLSIGKVFPLRTTRRFAHAHYRVTICCSGPLSSSRRVFTTPPDLPKARNGSDYPQDLWPVGSVGRSIAARGALRYPNTLPVTLVDRLVGALTRAPELAETAATTTRCTSRPAPVPDLVCDPFVGGGTTALVAHRRGLRFLGGDLNPAALAFTAARVSADLSPTREPRG